MTARTESRALPGDLTRARWQRFTANNPYLFALLLLVIAVLVNRTLQENLFDIGVLGRNMRNFLPLILLAAGQTIVIIGGGIDLSVGAMVSMLHSLLVVVIPADGGAGDVILGIAICLAAGMVAGSLNGLAVAYLRLQPIITTYATSFVFSGLALLILPRPGVQIPLDLPRFYAREMPLGLPIALYVILILVAFWLLLRGTRYGQFLFATGGKADAAYATGVPVNRVRFSTYVWSGLFAGLTALALTLNTGSGTLRIGDAMTLNSVVAVVLGGTRLSGGQGGILGTIFGVILLHVIGNIISFADVDTWSKVLVDALIIIVALGGPGVFRLLRRQVQS